MACGSLGPLCWAWSVFLVAAALLRPAAALLPSPKVWENGSLPLLLAPDFSITFDPSSFTSQKPPPKDLVGNVRLVEQYLQKDLFERLTVGRGEADRAHLHGAATLSDLVLFIPPSVDGTTRILSVSEEATKKCVDQDESYTLELGGGLSSLSANTTLGLYRGLQTFVQLIFALSDGQRYILGTPLYIWDAPSFCYRGFMLDTARHFFDLRSIERTLEAMSWAKLNFFHWHITESQSWPLEVPRYPLLAQRGAYGADRIYSTDDVRHIQEFAASRGISVLLEVDVPGHTASVAEGYPELVACANREPWMNWGVQPPTGQLRLMNDRVNRFVKRLFDGLAGQATGPFLSTGGDEVNMACYESDPATQVLLAASNMTLDEGISQLVSVAQDALARAGKTPVVWEEMVLERNISLAKDTVVMVWISSAHVKGVVDKGFTVVHAASDYFYLDCGGGGWIGNTISNSWCDPFKTWQKIYSFNPYANVDETHRLLILGGESLLWSEQADPSNLDPLAWPRAAVVAEVFWTGPTLADGSPRNAVEALPRIHEWRYRAVNRGIKAAPLQPEWCALRPGQCQI